MSSQTLTADRPVRAASTSTHRPQLPSPHARSDGPYRARDASGEISIFKVFLSRNKSSAVWNHPRRHSRPSVGHGVMFGLGGESPEILNDVSSRAVPISAVDAGKTIPKLRGHALLDGARGSLAASRSLLVRLLFEVGRADGLLMRHREKTEIDVNPLLVTAESIVAIDATERRGYRRYASRHGERPPSVAVSRSYRVPGLSLCRHGNDFT